MQNIETLQLIDINKVCETLSISRPTFYRMVKRGEITLIRIGRKPLVSLSAIRSYIEKMKERA